MAHCRLRAPLPRGRLRDGLTRLSRRSSPGANARFSAKKGTLGGSSLAAGVSAPTLGTAALGEGSGARGGQLLWIGAVGEAAAKEGAAGEARTNLEGGDRAGGQSVVAAAHR